MNLKTVLTIVRGRRKTRDRIANRKRTGHFYGITVEFSRLLPLLYANSAQEITLPSFFLSFFVVFSLFGFLSFPGSYGDDGVFAVLLIAFMRNSSFPCSPVAIGKHLSV